MPKEGPLANEDRRWWINTSVFVPSSEFHIDSQNVSKKTDPIAHSGNLVIIVLFINSSPFPVSRF